MKEAYYQQRASAGLIITESAPVSAEGVGYPRTPGLYIDPQAASWLWVTGAVHSALEVHLRTVAALRADIAPKPATGRDRTCWPVGIAAGGATFR